MSEQPSKSTAATISDQDKPDTSEPTPERQAELRAAYEANVAAGKPPYQGVPIRMQGELTWVLRERNWSGDPDLPDVKQRPDLRGASLVDADLSGTSLFSAVLSDADLTSANLNGADLISAILSGAVIEDATLSGTSLRGADLSGASLTNADLSGADLRIATLSGTSLVGADLSGANLTSARMDGSTTLNGVTLDGKTQLGDVRWNGVPLTRVSTWPSRLGDEQAIKAAKNRRERIAAYRDAARAYRGLSIALRGQGLLIQASDYRLREQVLERKASVLEGKLLGWIFSWLLDLIAGYGERPVRSFVAYLSVLFGFAGAYFAVTNGLFTFGSVATTTQPLQWYEAVILSISAFHGRGFFQPVQSLGDPVAILAAFEALIGLFIEITFIATFTSRFFGGR